MPGFILSIQDTPFEFPKESRNNLIVNSERGKGFNAERRVVNKFMNDRIFFNDEDYLLIVEGVILNNHILMQKHSTNSWKNCVVIMYKKYGDIFFNHFRGSFSGVLYDKGKDKWLIFTDQIGDKQVIYTKTSTGILIGTEVGFVVDTLKKYEYPIELDRDGVYMDLSIGFTIEDKTIFKDIKKLVAGHYLEITPNGVHEKQYHRFSNKPQSITLKDAIRRIDELFRNAIRLEFEKDKEYGYKHIACLSGGLDSRMTVWVAHELGYTKQTNITFSQSNYLDFTIAQQIATDLNHDFIFKTLDSGNCIYDIDDVTRINYGSANFFNTSHEKSIIDNLNFEHYGIVHTGQVGDVVVGSFQNKMVYGDPPKVSDGAYSTTIIEKLSNYSFKYEYEDVEIYKLYNRGFGGTAQGILCEQEYTEVISPFCDVDFLELCYSLPLEYRYNHKIYIDWILEMYPQAAEYIWEKLQDKISRRDNIITQNSSKSSTHSFIFCGKEILTPLHPDFFSHYKHALIKRLFPLSIQNPTIPVKRIATKQHMNPVQLWYNENNELQQFIKTYWETNKKYIQDRRILSDMEYLFDTDEIYNKLHCLTVVAALKRLNED